MEAIQELELPRIIVTGSISRSLDATNSFELFPKLCRELQDLVWEAAINASEPRIIAVKKIQNKEKVHAATVQTSCDSTSCDSTSCDSTSCDPYPAILYACRRSRNRALQLYHRFDQGLRRPIYFNCAKDVFLIDSVYNYRNHISPSAFPPAQSEETVSQAMSSIRFLAIDMGAPDSSQLVDDDSNDPDPFSKMSRCNVRETIRRFGGLETIFLVWVRDSSYRIPYRCELRSVREILRMDLETIVKKQRAKYASQNPPKLWIAPKISCVLRKYLASHLNCPSG